MTSDTVGNGERCRRRGLHTPAGQDTGTVSGGFRAGRGPGLQDGTVILRIMHGMADCTVAVHGGM